MYGGRLAGSSVSFGDVSVGPWVSAGWYIVPTFRHFACDDVLVGVNETAWPPAAISLSPRQGVIERDESAADARSQAAWMDCLLLAGASSGLRAVTALIKRRAGLTPSTELRAMLKTALQRLDERKDEHLDEWAQRLVREPSRAKD